jgi:L-2-hydroxyglutarate oxidase LhgO
VSAPSRSSTEVLVVGAGIVGLAVARQLSTIDGVRVTVVDKEDAVGRHQTSHNSGVVHAGIYYRPGSLKATLCRRGGAMLRQYCRDRGLPWLDVGKLVVATTPAEVARLDVLEGYARANGVEGVRRLDTAGLRRVEPEVQGMAALHSPTTAVTDFRAVALAFAEDVVAAGGTVQLGRSVVDIQQGREHAVVRTTAHEYRVDHVVVCAGLQADRVARSAGDTAGPAIVPFRGEYLDLVPAARGLVRGLVYPVPDPAYPFLGVHVTRRVDGGVDIGPNAVAALAREGYRWRDVNVRDLAASAAWPGARRLVRRHWRTGLEEMVGSVHREHFVRRVQRYLPALRLEDVQPGARGVRAQAVDSDGTLVDDFRIHALGRVTAVRNAPSPAATSSLAIAEHVASGVLELLHGGGKPGAVRIG